MALVDSLLSAIVRADGDALVMHVGERPYVVVGTQTINISTHGMNLDAMTGMLSQLLPADSMAQLEEFGAVEYRVPHEGDDRFSVVAARGGDDIWIEIRRRRQPAVAVEAPKAPEVEAPAPEPVAEPIAAQAPAEPVAEPIAAQGPPEPEPVAAQPAEPEPVVVNAQLEPIAVASAEPPAAPKHLIDSLLAEAPPAIDVISLSELAVEPASEAAPSEVPEPVYVMEALAGAEFQTAQIEMIETEPQIAAEAAPLEPGAEAAPEPFPASVAETLAQPLWGTIDETPARPEPAAEPIAEFFPEAVAAVPGPIADPIPESASAREESGELRRDLAEAAFGREGGPVAAVPEPIVEPIPEPVASVPEPIVEPIPEPVASVPEPIVEPIPEPVASVPEPIVEPIPEPVASVPEPIVEPIPEPVAAVPEPIVEPIPEPVAAVPEPIVEPIPEPVAAVPEPIVEPIPEPVAAVPEPIVEPIPEPVAAVPEPIVEPIPEPVAAVPEPIVEPIPEPVAAVPEPIVEPIPEPVAAVPEPIVEPIPEPVAVVAEPIVEPIPEPVAVVAEPIVEPIPEPVAVVAEPIVEPIPEPVAAVPEPIVEPIPEPVAAVPEPIVEPIPEPVAAVPEPIVEPIPEPVAVVAEPIVEPIPEPVAVVAAPVVESIPEPVAAVPEPIVEPIPEPVAAVPEPIADPIPEPVAVVAAPVVESIPEPVAAVPEPIVEPIPEPVAVVAEPIVEPIPEPVAVVAAPVVEPIPEPVAAVPEPIVEPIPEPVAVVAEPIVEPIPESASAREESGELRRDLAEAAFGREGGPEPIVEPAAQMPEPASMPEPAPMPIAASIETAPAAHQRELTSGNVLSMTRTVRIEVPSPRVAARTSADIERLLRIAVARGASALFLSSESRPWIRVEGDLRQLESESALSKADVERAIMDMAPESGHESIGKGEATEWLSEFADIGRIRCTTFNDHRGPGVLLRMIATRAATAEQLGLAREVQALATEPQGIVLVAGPRGSGKSTLLSALVDLVNRQRAEFVITIERQIRLVHDNKNALVSQREIRGGAEDSVTAARSALRENPDVLVIDDLISSHMVPLLLTAASEGLLVFVSITAPSTTDAAERFIELAPPEMRKAVQTAMAESFRGAVAQTLLKKAGGGLVAAREILLATAPVTRVIADGQLSQLPLALESGRKHGMVSFTEALAEFVRSGTVDVREAFRKAPDRARLLQQLKRDGVDTSVVERLA